MNKKSTPARNGKRIALVVLCIVLSLILILLVTGTILLKGFLGKIERIEGTGIYRGSS